MPFALVFIGLMMIVTGSRDTYRAFGDQLRADFTGPNNFTFWLASLGTVGMLGYIEALRPFSRAFLALIIIAMVIRNGGFFDRFQEALREGPIAPPRAPSTAFNPDVQPYPGDPRTAAEYEEGAAINLRRSTDPAVTGTTGSFFGDIDAILDDPIGLPVRRTRSWLDTLWNELFGTRPAY